MNTGTKQATIAYKTTIDGQPVDVQGQLISVSGNKQAIALLTGWPNPDPALYDVEMYFTSGALVNGAPTSVIDLTYCPVSIFMIDKNYIVLHPGHASEGFNIYSSFGWHMVGTYNYATIAPTTGGAESTAVLATRTATLGQGFVSFQDNVTGIIKKVYVVNTDALGWILETGNWNDLRFWEANGIWNY